MNTLSSNKTDIAITNSDFLMYGFAGLDLDEQFWVAGFPGDPYDVQPWMWGGKGAPPGLPGFIRPNHNNYIAVSSFKRGTDGRFHRRKANFGRMFMVMIDDVGTKVGFERLALLPSALVETSPGNYQAWYFLVTPEPDRGKAERLIDGMIAAGLTADASDPGMKGVTRYGRLPVGVNGKGKYVEKLGAPFVQTVAVWDPATRYSIEEIAAAYGVDLTAAPPPTRRTNRRMPSAAPIGGDALVAQLVDAGLYLEPELSVAGMHRIVCPWVHEHTDEEPSGTAYFEPSEDNDSRGGFKCHHGHCAHRRVSDLKLFLSYLQSLTKENHHA
ncbi:MAG: hypothetical protein IPM27_02425 [Nitrosomonadales bacterium]|nr:hypothetical protein [Nitrosomonadales bacterium]